MILLDTHAWIWWMEQPERLSQTALRAMETEDRLGVSPVSCWELAMLASKARVQLDRATGAWVQAALSQDGIEEVALTAQIAVAAGDLPRSFHGDPADRLIAATAIAHGVALVMADRRLLDNPDLYTLW